MKFRLAVAVAVTLLPLGLFAQEFRGTLSGTVTDPTGTSVAGAKVTVTETHTGTKNESLTNSGGQYTAPFLLPGDYDIAAQVQGFKEFIRKGVHVGAGDHPVIDIRLDVGEVTQTMEVTADAPQLNTENASAGQSITTKEVEDLPLNGGTPMALATLSLGVIGTGQPGLIHPFDSGAAAGFSVAGGYAQTSELQVDGSPNATWDGRLAFSVPKDAVQELRVKAFDSDAANGHSGGGTFNQVLKTGTNDLRGTLWEQNQPNTLTANDFFNNAKGVARPVSHLNQYGVTAGGPVYIPKVFNGRNKLFWFFAYEAMKDGQPNPTFTTVPTAAERTGDFSKLLAVDGASTQLYDPYSGTQTGSTISRTPYAGNKIPTTQLNPIALNYLQFYPAPNLAVPVRPDDYQNFGNSATTNDDYNNQLGRLDYNMNDKSRLYMNIRRTGYSQVKNNYFAERRGRLRALSQQLGRLARRSLHHQLFQRGGHPGQLHAHGRIARVAQHGLRSDGVGLPLVSGVERAVSADAGDFLQQQYQLPELEQQRQQQSALSILPALHHLHEDQGQPHSEGWRGPPPVSPEYLHGRQLHRHLQFLRQ